MNKQQIVKILHDNTYWLDANETPSRIKVVDKGKAAEAILALLNSKDDRNIELLGNGDYLE